MRRYIFAFPSITIAHKAQNILRERGFGADVIRTPKNLSSGCGYSVIVSGSVQNASMALEDNNINPKAVGEYLY